MNNIQKALLVEANLYAETYPRYTKELINEVVAFGFKDIWKGIKKQFSDYDYYVFFDINKYTIVGKKVSIDKEERKKGAETFLSPIVGYGGQGYRNFRKNLNFVDGKWRIPVHAADVKGILDEIKSGDAIVPSDSGHYYKVDNFILSTVEKGEFHKGVPYNKNNWKKVVKDTTINSIVLEVQKELSKNLNLDNINKLFD